MTAAIYARKSTEQRGDDESKSVTRQIENARAFAASKGWTVADEHIYIDDAVSGAESKRLLARQRLLAAIEAGHFDALIMREVSRFSRRDGDEAFGELKRIDRAGVQVWFYGNGTRFTHGDIGSNISWIAQHERRGPATTGCRTSVARGPRPQGATWSGGG